MALQPPPDMSPSEKESHLFYMREALKMAELALSTSETPVGCILLHVPTKTIIGRGLNATNKSYNGTRHAEFIAISEVLTTPSSPTQNQEIEGEKDEKRNRGMKYGPEVLKECDLYVTVEPCIMCASLLRQFGIRKVYFGASNEKFGGCGGVLSIHDRNGKQILVDAGDAEQREEGEGEEREKEDVGGEGDYEVSGGWLREECIVILRRFYVQENGRAPEPRSKGNRVLKLEVEPLGVGEK